MKWIYFYLDLNWFAKLQSCVSYRTETAFIRNLKYFTYFESCFNIKSCIIALFSRSLPYFDVGSQNFFRFLSLSLHNITYILKFFISGSAQFWLWKLRHLVHAICCFAELWCYCCWKSDWQGTDLITTLFVHNINKFYFIILKCEERRFADFSWHMK